MIDRLIGLAVVLGAILAFTYGGIFAYENGMSLWQKFRTPELSTFYIQGKYGRIYKFNAVSEDDAFAQYCLSTWECPVGTVFTVEGY